MKSQRVRTGSPSLVACTLLLFNLCVAQPVKEVFLSELTPAQGWGVVGSDAYPDLGETLHPAGDVNQDGFDDFLVGAPSAAVNGDADAGFALLVYGRASSLTMPLSADAIDGSNGVLLTAGSDQNGVGVAFTAGCDLNADDIDDLVIGSHGDAFVVFGTGTALPHPFDLTTLDGSTGFRITGKATASMACLGDMNDDAIDDLLIGDYRGSSMPRAQAHVLFGSDQGFASMLDVNSINGVNGFTIQSSDLDGAFGGVVSSAGDFNADGLHDLMIAAPLEGGSEHGAVYVIYGSTTPLSHPFSVADLNGANGFRIRGNGFQAAFGNVMDVIGRFNADTADDLIIGDMWADNSVEDRNGAAYVLFGQSASMPADMSVADLTGTNGFKIEHTDFNTALVGFSVARAGDTNKDGLDDVMIGIPQAIHFTEGQVGRASVIYGTDEAIPAVVNLWFDTATPHVDIHGLGESNQFGSAVGSAGDVNGDGVSDVMLSTPFRDGFGAGPPGLAYVVFGEGDLFADGFEQAD